VVAWNEAAVKVFTDFRKMPADRCNLLWFTFQQEGVRSLFRGWDAYAKCVLAKFRGERGLVDQSLIDRSRLLRASSLGLRAGGHASGASHPTIVSVDVICAGRDRIMDHWKSDLQAIDLSAWPSVAHTEPDEPAQRVRRDSTAMEKRTLGPTADQCRAHHSLLEMIPASICRQAANFDTALRAISRYRTHRFARNRRLR
jgi:hypothetical protein